MKKVFSLIILLCLTFLTWAQSKEEREVSAAVETLRKALLDGDKKALESITASDLSYGHSSGKIEDQATFVDRLVTGDSDFKTIELSEQTIKIVGNTAIVRHKLMATASDKGQPTTPNLSILLIFQKQNGKWKLLARQAVRNQ